MNIERIKEKLQSKVVWLTAIPMICYIVYAIETRVFDLETLLTTVVGLLALFGILNDPNDRGQF